MKSLFHLALFIGLIFLTAFSTPQDQILGNWFAADLENATIEIYKAKDGYLYGKITDCDKKDWVGEIVLKKLKYDDSKKQWKGKIYSLQRRMSIAATITITEDNRLKLVGTKLLITKTFYWTRGR